MTDLSTADIRRGWEQRGYNFFDWHDVPGKNWPPIIHPFDEVVVLIEGSLTFVVDGERIDLEPGNEIFVPAGAVHSVHNAGSSKNHWCYGYKLKCQQEN